MKGEGGGAELERESQKAEYETEEGGEGMRNAETRKAEEEGGDAEC